MTDFFIEPDSGRREVGRVREINESLAPEFVVAISLDEHEDVEERIQATRWLGRREETHGLFYAVQLVHISSTTERIRNNACVNLLAAVVSDRNSLALHLPESNGYRDRMFRTMSRLDFEDVDWTLRLVKFAIDEPHDEGTLAEAYERYREWRSTYVRRWEFPIIDAMDLANKAFRTLITRRSTAE